MSRPVIPFLTAHARKFVTCFYSSSCRPLNLQYIKETKTVTLDEINRVQNEINFLRPFETVLENNRRVKVTFTMKFTALDGKVLAAAEGVSCQRCPVCKAKPSEFNKKVNVHSSSDNFPAAEAALEHGVSCLHARIRFMEHLLKIAYRMDVAKYRITCEEDKEKVKKAKKNIQLEFLNKMSLRIDFPVPGGSGSSNDGNTARKFFENFQESARILGINENLLFRYKIILTALNCQFPLQAEKFGHFCAETYNLLIDLYPWYLIPPTVHKILIHSKEIILRSVLPLGMLSEEGAETRNKFYRYDRLHHSRKTSRKNSLTDIFNRALDTSDPYVTSIGMHARKRLGNRLPFPAEVLSFIKAPEVDVLQSLSQNSNASSQSSQNSVCDGAEDLESWLHYVEDLVVVEAEEDV